MGDRQPRRHDLLGYGDLPFGSEDQEVVREWADYRVLPPFGAFLANPRPVLAILRAEFGPLEDWPTVLELYEVLYETTTGRLIRKSEREEVAEADRLSAAYRKSRAELIERQQQE